MRQPARQYGRVFYPGYYPMVPGQQKIRPFNVGRNAAKRLLRATAAYVRRTERARRSAVIKAAEAASNKATLYARLRSM